jgi:hypothetical protein
MSVSLENEIPRIEGIPAKDGAYWHYKRGQVVPNLVLVGGADGQRAFKDGPALHHYWYPGEFFVGPIEPPFARRTTWRTSDRATTAKSYTRTRQPGWQ